MVLLRQFTSLLAAAAIVAASPAPVPAERTAGQAEKRQTITTLSTAQIDAFTPYSNYAAAGYCAASATLTWTCGSLCDANPGFRPVASGGDGNGVQFWFVGYDPALQTVIVSYQGTDPSHILSLVEDGEILLKALDPTLFPGLPSGIEAHTGFVNDHAATATDVLAAVKTALSTSGFSKVTIVGHSLGGALGLLSSVYLPLWIPGVTFRAILYGLPRVGNTAFATHASIGNIVTHINNKEDLIPILPGRFLGYAHPTGEIHIQDSGAWEACPGMDNTSTLCIVGDVPNIFDGDEANHDGPYNGVEFSSTCPA